MIAIGQIIDDLIEREGEYSNRSADRGGPTNFGITLKTLRWVRDNADLTAEDVKRLTKDEAHIIYQQKYIEAPGYNLIPNDKLKVQLVDFGVNSGPDRATKALQRVIGVKDDGHIGQITLAALTRFGYSKANNLLMVERILLLGRIVRDDPTQSENINGWLIRATGFLIP